MNSYIANSRIATGLRDGSITAIMVRCKPQPSMLLDNLVLDFSHDKVIHSYPKEQRKFPLPYALGKEVYVREAITHTTLAMAIYKADNSPVMRNGEQLHIDDIAPNTGYISACSEKYARTWITPVSVECKRVQELPASDIFNSLGYGRFSLWEDNLIDFVTHNKSAWDNNEYVFIYHVKTRIV